MKYKSLLISYIILSISIAVSILLFISKLLITKPNDFIAAFISLIFLNAVLSIFLAYRLLKTKKEVRIFNLIIFVSLLTVIILPAIPGLIKVFRCKSIDLYSRTGACFTVLDNAKAYIMLLLAIFYSFIFTLASTLGGIIAKHTRSFIKGLIVGIIILIIFTGYTLISRLFLLKNQKEFNSKRILQEDPRAGQETLIYETVEDDLNKVKNMSPQTITIKDPRVDQIKEDKVNLHNVEGETVETDLNMLRDAF